MIINCISDLHGHYPELEGGDLLIVAGDVGAENLKGYLEFTQWMCQQPYKRRVFIGGNHDNELVAIDGRHVERTNLTYLYDSGTEFEGLKIWGSPWTKRFEGMNPDCMAFTCDTEDELAEKWALIPEDTDILVTHSPLAGFLDKTTEGKNVGSNSLKSQIWRMDPPPKLIICGHIHEGYGQTFDIWYEFSSDEVEMQLVNASHVNERYEPVNKPIRIEL